MKNDGNIRIGIKITDTDRQVKNVEGKIQLLNNKLKNLGSEKMPLQNRLQEIEQQMEENEAEYRKFQEMLSDGKLTGSEYQALGGIEGIQKNITSLEHANDNLNIKADSLQKKIDAINSKEQETNVKLSEQERLREELLEKQKRLNNEQASSGTDLNDIGKKIKGITSKVIKWSLAVFSIRSAYTFVRQAMSTLTQYNEQMSTDIEYIRYALANMIKPIIEWIINAVYKILAYINYIAKAWFNVNLFENAGAEQFNKDLQKANGTAKELKKQLSSFDVANVMSDTSDKKSGSGTKMPSFDLSNMKQIEIPDWVKWIAEHKDEIIMLAEIVGIAFGTVKTASILANISKIMGVAGSATGAGATGLIGLVSILGIIAGLATIVITVSYFMKDRAQLKEDIKNIRELNQNKNQQYNKDIKANTKVTDLTGKTKVNIQAGEESLKQSNNWLYKITGMSEDALDNAKGVAENTDSILEATKTMWQYEKRSLDDKMEMFGVLNDQYNLNLKVIDALKEQGKETKDLEESNEKLKTQISEYRQELNKSPEYVQRINDAWNEPVKKLDSIFLKTKAINDMEIKDKSFKINLNDSDTKKKLSSLIDSAIFYNSALLKQFNPSLYSSMMTKIQSFRKQYGLDGGGLVLPQPGHGVPVGSTAIMSERRAEAVIPFENPTAMEKIGQAIGRYVNIAIDNKMVVDGRVLATATNNQVSKEKFLMNR